MYYYNPDEREAKELVPGINARTFWAEKMLAAVVDLDPNVLLPRHSHPHEQMGIVIEGQIELRVVARLAGVSLEEFQQLNPAYERALTPPRGVNTFLVPASVEPVIGMRIAGLTREQRVQSIRHRIRVGDNLSTIAQHYGTTVRALRLANRLNSNRIIAGEILLVPAGEDGQKLADAGLSDP